MLCVRMGPFGVGQSLGCGEVMSPAPPRSLPGVIQTPVEQTGLKWSLHPQTVPTAGGPPSFCGPEGDMLRGSHGTFQSVVQVGVFVGGGPCSDGRRTHFSILIRHREPANQGRCHCPGSFRRMQHWLLSLAAST